MTHATANNHVRAVATRRGNRSDAEFSLYERMALAAGFPATVRGVRSSIVARVRSRDRVQSDAWALTCAHVNTAAPPPVQTPDIATTVYAHEPRRIPVQFQLPARAASLITAGLIKESVGKEFVDDVEARRERVMAGLMKEWAALNKQYGGPAWTITQAYEAGRKAA